METRRMNGFEFISGEWPLDETKRTLIFIHGAALNSKIWRDQVEGLSEHVNTISITLPGHEESPGEALGSIEAYADAVLDYMEVFKIPDPILCGLSMGGAIVLHLLLHSELVSGGIVVNTGAKQKVNPLIFDSIEKNYDEFKAMVGTFGISPECTSKEIHLKLNEATTGMPEVALGDFRACDNFDVMAELHKIDRPVLVLTAKDDNLSPPKYGEFLKANIKQASLVCIEGAGHFSPVEKPEIINGAILSFLGDLPR